MKNDYLWDKKGNDAEIERLENALQAFRYQPTAPPIISQKVLEIEEKPKFNFFSNIFRFAFAGAASLAILIISLGLWISFSTNKTVEVGEINSPLVEPTNVETQTNVNTKIQLLKDEIDIKKQVEPQMIKAKLDRVPKLTKTVFQTKVVKVKTNKSDKLTEEEKDAYNQLILALSITGSRLKEVNDKANGIIKTATAVK